MDKLRAMNNEDDEGPALVDAVDYHRLASAIDDKHFAYLLPALKSAARAWMIEARCATEPTATFYVDRKRTLELARARDMCVGCTVRWKCLDYALRTSERFGVWGGHPDKERRAIKRLVARGVPLRTASGMVRPGQAESSSSARI